MNLTGFIKNFANFFFPPVCKNCNTNLEYKNDLLCDYCKSKLEVIDVTFLEKEFNKKFLSEGLIENLSSKFIFTQDSIIQNLIHKLKYNSNFRIGEALGEMITNEITTRSEISCIVPVPIYITRRLNRGYNQSDFIAKGISKLLDKPVFNKVITRVKNTPSQTNLTIEERRENVRDAFKIKDRSKIESKNILLVDDVITTGATINSCAKTLKQSGANKIFAASVAIPSDHILSGAEIPSMESPLRKT